MAPKRVEAPIPAPTSEVYASSSDSEAMDIVSPPVAPPKPVKPRAPKKPKEPESKVADAGVVKSKAGRPKPMKLPVPLHRKLVSHFNNVNMYSKKAIEILNELKNQAEAQQQAAAEKAHEKEKEKAGEAKEAKEAKASKAAKPKPKQ